MRSLEQVLLELVSKHGPRGILVDTNVLLLYLFGLYQPAIVGQQRRLTHYSPDDAGTGCISRSRHPAADR
ncbi:hypothetical protein LPN04_01260 [Rugamonas sp. A1-17]|nr:hypothetical protein [Rugamonas sp. A1-17]